MDNRIVFENPDGSVGVIIPADECPLSLAEIAAKDVPAGRPFHHKSVADLPASRLFRNAWKWNNGISKVDHDLPKAVEIAHTYRRLKRDALLAPYDEVIAKQIPGQSAAQAEAARATIRANDASVQAQLDAAASVEDLKQLLVNYGAVPPNV